MRRRGRAWAGLLLLAGALCWGKRAAAEVIEKWKDRLGGVEQFTADNCWVMSQCLRLNDGYAMPVRPAS